MLFKIVNCHDVQLCSRFWIQPQLADSAMEMEVFRTFRLSVVFVSTCNGLGWSNLWGVWTMFEGILGGRVDLLVTLCDLRSMWCGSVHTTSSVVLCIIWNFETFTNDCEPVWGIYVELRDACVRCRCTGGSLACRGWKVASWALGSPGTYR